MINEFEKNNSITIAREYLLPKNIVLENCVADSSYLLEKKPLTPLFTDNKIITFKDKGAFVVLDFGKELCGGARIITGACSSNTLVHLVFGESLSEALSDVNVASSTNDHSPRDFCVPLSSMSDLCYGKTGFRFLKIELISDGFVNIQSILAESILPVFDNENIPQTSDKLLQDIIDTAAYTVKLCFQQGYIFDGIKRDRLVWAGDLHPEILTSLYLFGDTPNIKNSLDFLKGCTPQNRWINNIPSYSAWWIICLCDYCRFTDNKEYFEENASYAETIFENLNNSTDETGKMKFEHCVMEFFADWQTYGTDEAEIGVAAIIMIAAQKFLQFKENKHCTAILEKLKVYLLADTTFKQIRALQILAGRRDVGDAQMLQKDGAVGYSTFMSYYILKATAISGGKNTIEIIKEYYGAMLKLGATTFWEDFDINWLKNGGRIDMPLNEGQIDVHKTYGRECYTGLRHSLCHGWSSGVLAFIVEELINT
ncbi:MAG: hypothetical protein U0M42_03925 [Acutalibacteraceae bacterium]|nr:hypothetical protein [Acutalibacteraceae bacterium]